MGDYAGFGIWQLPARSLTDGHPATILPGMLRLPGARWARNSPVPKIHLQPHAAKRLWAASRSRTRCDRYRRFSRTSPAPRSFGRCDCVRMLALAYRPRPQARARGPAQRRAVTHRRAYLARPAKRACIYGGARKFVLRFNRRATRHAVFRRLLGRGTMVGPITYNMRMKPEAGA